MNLPSTELYFESHVTIEPVFGEWLEQVKHIANKYGFRVADLIMKKAANETPSPNQEDTFCTGRSKFFQDLRERTYHLVVDLKNNGFNVYRYKIENTLMDSRHEDIMKLLGE